MSAVQELNRLGQSVWLDNLSRTHLREGELKDLIDEGVTGITSNPTIFHKAITTSPYYIDDLAYYKQSEAVTERRYEALVIPDIRAACDLLRPVYERSKGDDGYVSLEVSPRLAHDEAGTLNEAKRLHDTVGRDNLLIKVPGTPEGVQAFERLIADGISVNVTLLFSLQHVVRIFEAYIRGLNAFVAKGGDATRIKSVASIFMSRVDTLVDKKLESIGTQEALDMRGRAAVAMAKLAYQRYREIFHGELFADLRRLNARPQYLLWASTSVKNPAYSDLLYVGPLIGPETVNTMPDATIAAFRDHGIPRYTVENGVEDAQNHFLALEKLGVDMQAIGDELQVQGVKLFDDSFTQLLDAVR